MIELLRKLRDALARRRLSDELREELRFHQGELARDARAAGMNIADADAAASRRLGNATAILEDARSMWTLHWLDNLGQDIRYGLRALRRNPGFTVVAALTLALGIGATTAIFTIVNGVILRPLPYKDADRLVIVWERMPDAPQIMVSYPNFLDWRSRVHAFEGAAIYNPFNQFTLTNLGDAARVNGGYASGNFFDVYGVRAARGRLFEARDDRVGADPVAVVTNSFWLRRLGADSLAVGKPLTLDGVTYTVVGVLAPGIQPSGVDVWIPIGLFANSDRFAPRSNHPGTIVLGRLKPGMTLSDMQRDLDGVYAQLRADHGENAGISASGTWISEIILGDVRRPLYIFAGAVGLVLLIACANVASLLLGRAASRSREIALRLAIGARRGRIIRQLLTESVLLSVVGGVLGALLAYGAVRVFVGLRPPSVPRLAEIHVDTHVMLFAAGISVVTGIIFGLVPALQTVQGDLFRSLRDGARGATAGRQRLRLRSALMLGEVMLALVLLVGAGLLARSFQKLANVDVGIDARNLVAGYVSLPPKTYPDSVKRVQFFEALLEKARTIPGVTEVALGGDLPPGTSWQTGVTFMSLPPVQPGKEPLLNAMVASPAWFETVKMRVISGRAFTDADVAGGVRVAIISENVARKFFGAKNPLGELVKRGRASSTGTPATIIGVVNEVRNDGLRVTSKGTIYFPLAQSEAANMWIVARTTAGSGAVIPALRTALASLDKDIPLAQPQKVEEHLASEVSEPKFSMLMLGTFALIALALAAIGIYGVIAYAVSLRTHEIGVRVALGASARTVLLLIVRQVLAITGAGIALGVVAALLSGKVIAKMLFGVSPSDPMAIAAGCVVLGAVALLAAAIPAWRATRMDPVAALRAE